MWNVYDVALAAGKATKVTSAGVRIGHGAISRRNSTSSVLLSLQVIVNWLLSGATCADRLLGAPRPLAEPADPELAEPAEAEPEPRSSSNWLEHPAQAR